MRTLRQSLILLVLFVISASVQAQPQQKEANTLVVKETSLGQRRSDFVGLETVSDNGEHLAYAAGKPGAAFIVVDGVPGKPYENLGTTLVLSPNGTPAFYVQLGGKYRVVFGEIGSDQYDGILEDTPILSPDGKRMAFGAARGTKRLIVIDRKESREYDLVGQDCLTFSPDGQRLAFRAQLGNKQFVVVDGVEGKMYDGIGEGNFSFSPDGKHVAYAANEGQRRFFVVDGAEQRAYEATRERLVFSLDGSRIAYPAFRDGKWFVVFTKNEGKGYDGVGFIRMSDQGDHIAYAAQRGNIQLVVHDNLEGKDYQSLIVAPVLSPDGKRVAYAAKRTDGGVLLVVDGKENDQYDRVEAVTFSTDSRHFAFIGRRTSNWYVVVDGKETTAYDRFPGSKLFFRSTGVLATVAQRNNEYLRLEIKPTAPERADTPKPPKSENERPQTSLTPFGADRFRVNYALIGLYRSTAVVVWREDWIDAGKLPPYITTPVKPVDRIELKVSDQHPPNRKLVVIELEVSVHDHPISSRGLANFLNTSSLSVKTPDGKKHVRVADPAPRGQISGGLIYCAGQDSQKDRNAVWLQIVASDLFQMNIPGFYEFVWSSGPVASSPLTLEIK